jgi:hypothetical protein
MKKSEVLVQSFIQRLLYNLHYKQNLQHRAA